MKSLSLVVLLTLGSCLQSSVAQNNGLDSTRTVSQTENPKQERLDKAYELLYRKSETAQGRLISTFQWAVGLFLAVIVAVIGSQVFFNYRISQKEIDRVESDLNSKMSDIRADLLKSISEKQETAISNVRNELEDKTNQIASEIKADNHINSVEIESQERRVKQLEADIEKNDARLWILEGVEGNALSAFIRAASIQLELDYDLKYSLADVIKTLKSMDRISDSSLYRLRKLLKDLPEKYSAQRKRIEEELKEKSVYKLNQDLMEGFPGIFGSGRLNFRNSDDEDL